VINKSLSKIAELRTKVRLTQLELADHMGVSEVTIGNWERGRSGDLEIERVARLAATLECTMHDLLTKNISELRHSAGLSQRELAMAVGAREGTIIAWEKKHTLEKKIEKVARLCLALGCETPDELLSEPPKKPKGSSNLRLSSQDLVKRFSKINSQTPGLVDLSNSEEQRAT
jgi:transcriptional regulator with XRE-family HTH domain